MDKEFTTKMKLFHTINLQQLKKKIVNYCGGCWDSCWDGCQGSCWGGCWVATGMTGGMPTKARLGA